MPPKIHSIEPVPHYKMRPLEEWLQYRRLGCIGCDLTLFWRASEVVDYDILSCLNCGSQVVILDQGRVYRKMYQALDPTRIEQKLLAYLLLGRSFGQYVEWVVATYFEKECALEHRNLVQGRWSELEKLDIEGDEEYLHRGPNEYDPYCKYSSDCWYSVQQVALVQHVDQFLEHFGG